MYTQIHMHMHISIRFCRIHEKQRTFFLKVSKNNKQISVFGCLVDLSLWNYSQRFGSLKNRKKQMYVYINIYVLCFCFQELDAIVFFLCLLQELSTIRTEYKLNCNRYCCCFSTGDRELNPQLFFKGQTRLQGKFSGFTRVLEIT